MKRETKEEELIIFACLMIAYGILMYYFGAKYGL